MGKHWTDVEVNILKRMHPNSLNSDIAKLLRKTENSVRYKASKLGLKKPETWRASVSRNVYKNSTKVRAALKKGRSLASVGNFKERNIPWNTRKDGDISKTNKGWMIRLSVNNWIPYKDFIWQNENGQIPEGHIVVIKDRGRELEDVRLDNLLLITRAENMRRNQNRKKAVNTCKRKRALREVMNLYRRTT